MQSARGEPVARTGPEGRNRCRLDPRFGLCRNVISVRATQSAVGRPLLPGDLDSRFEVALLRAGGPANRAHRLARKAGASK